MFQVNNTNAKVLYLVAFTGLHWLDALVRQTDLSVAVVQVYCACVVGHLQNQTGLTI